MNSYSVQRAIAVKSIKSKKKKKRERIEKGVLIFKIKLLI